MQVLIALAHGLIEYRSLYYLVSQHQSNSSKEGSHDLVFPCSKANTLSFTKRATVSIVYIKECKLKRIVSFGLDATLQAFCLNVRATTFIHLKRLVGL